MASSIRIRLEALQAAHQASMNRRPPDMTRIYAELGVTDEVRGLAMAEKCSIAQVLGLTRRACEAARGQHGYD